MAEPTVATHCPYFRSVSPGTPNIDLNRLFLMAAGAAAVTMALGLDRGLPSPLDDIPHATAILLAGANIAERSPSKRQRPRSKPPSSSSSNYREHANYLERTYDFVERLGIDKVRKETVYAPESGRWGLVDRLQKSKAASHDAWLEGQSPVNPT